MLLPALRSLTMHDLASFGVPGLLKIRVQGQSTLPKDGPVLLLANRTSLLDPWLVALAAGRPVQMGAVSPLFWLPGLGDLANRMNIIPLVPEESHSPTSDWSRQYARALERGHPVAVFADLQLEPRPEGPRYTLPPGFLDVLLATRSDRIPVVPLLAVGQGRKLNLKTTPFLSSLVNASSQVMQAAYPPVLYSDNALRIGRPVYWRDGSRETTLQGFRREVEDSLGALF
jgi:1-acyl-sn-glycerol-3-phosphate acyltransferase